MYKSPFSTSDKINPMVYINLIASVMDGFCPSVFPSPPGSSFCPMNFGLSFYLHADTSSFLPVTIQTQGNCPSNNISTKINPGWIIKLDTKILQPSHISFSPASVSAPTPYRSTIIKSAVPLTTTRTCTTVQTVQNTPRLDGRQNCTGCG